MNVALKVSFPRWLMPAIKFYAIARFIFSRRDEDAVNRIAGHAAHLMVKHSRIEICDVA